MKSQSGVYRLQKCESTLEKTWNQTPRLGIRLTKIIIIKTIINVLLYIYYYFLVNRDMLISISVKVTDLLTRTNLTLVTHQMHEKNVRVVSATCWESVYSKKSLLCYLKYIFEKNLHTVQEPHPEAHFTKPHWFCDISGL